jgi:hypothetical protein
MGILPFPSPDVKRYSSLIGGELTGPVGYVPPGVIARLMGRPVPASLICRPWVSFGRGEPQFGALAAGAMAVDRPPEPQSGDGDSEEAAARARQILEGTPAETERAAIEDLANLEPLEYQRRRHESAEALDKPLKLLDEEVKAKQKEGEAKRAQGKPLEMPVRELWSEPVDGAALADEMVAYALRYISMPQDDAVKQALWVMGAHAVNAFFIFPRLHIKSPVSQCGKSTLMDVIESAVNKPLLVSNITASPLFRIIEAAQPTCLLDEADLYLKNNPEVTSIINAGHKRGATAIRCVGNDFIPKEFKVYAPLVIAGIGDQADTIESRSIKIELQRKKKSEVLESFRPDRVGDVIARKCARWAQENALALGGSDPETEGLYNRTADNWRPLFAVADLLGGHWPETVRQVAARAIVTGGDDTLRMRLLRDIRTVFEALGKDAISSEDLVWQLGTGTLSLDVSLATPVIQDGPWKTCNRGRPLDQNRLAYYLRDYKIRTDDIRFGATVKKGYRRAWFVDLWERYLGADE